MDKKTYMNKIQKLLDLKLSQKRSDLIIEARELIKKEISLAVKEVLEFSKNNNKKFYDLDKSFIESGNFVQHKILHRLVSFESISWNNKTGKVDFNIDLFEKEINLTEILSDKLDEINTGIHPFMLMIYSGKTDPDFFAEHFIDNLRNLFQTVLDLEEKDFELIKKLIESQPDDLKNNFSDPSLVLSGIILSGYKPPFIMDKNDLDDLKYFIKVNGYPFAEKLIVLFSIVAKNKLFNK